MFDDLPNEIVGKILSYLDFMDLVTTRQIKCLRDESERLIKEPAARIIQKYLKLLTHRCTAYDNENQKIIESKIHRLLLKRHIFGPFCKCRALYGCLFDRIDYTIIYGTNISKTWLSVNGAELLGTRNYYTFKKDVPQYYLIEHPHICGVRGLPRTTPAIMMYLCCNKDAYIIKQFQVFQAFKLNYHDTPQFRLEEIFFNTSESFTCHYNPLL